MKNKIEFRDLRRLLLDLGFHERKYKESDFKEKLMPNAIVFDHGSSNTMFVFRDYRPTDPVANYNLNEVRMMLDSRGLMDASSFEEQFKKTPA
jgi:hypothetical protein